jgi:hypothetical protein
MQIPKFSQLGHMNEYVQPITPAKGFIPEVERVRRHIVDNPGVSVREMVDALGLDAQNIRNSVCRLNANGHIRRQAPRAGEKRVRWEAGPDQNYENRIAEYGQPKQTTVSTWEPCTLTDPMIDHLFGRVK